MFYKLLIVKYKESFIFLIILFYFTSCSERLLMYSYVNDAKKCGYIVVKRSDDKICDIQVSLSDPDSVENYATRNTNYIVWFEFLDNKIQNIGKLESYKTKNSITYKLFSHISTICVNNPVRIFVTEEVNVNTTSPSSMIIASSKKF